MNLRTVGAALAAATAGVLLSVTPAAAAPVNPVQQAVDRSVAAAAAQGIEQSISVLDRATGAQVAGSGGGTQYISESIVKLFTVAYYEVQNAGHPDDSLAETMRTMIINSDDDIESSLWNVDIVPSMAARYGLSNTSNGPLTGPHDWGWELITADDETKFLYEMSNDSLVAPILLEAMAATAPSGADGSDQFFGMNTVSGDHGSKQGWTDADAGSSEPAEIHSVGWTDQYFVAILQTADGPDFEEMRSSATAAAQAIQATEEGSNPEPDAAAPDDPTTDDPTTDDPTTDDPTTDDDVPQAPATGNSTAGAQAGATTPAPAAPPTATPLPNGGFPKLIAALRHDFDVLIADMAALLANWK